MPADAAAPPFTPPPPGARADFGQLPERFRTHLHWIGTSRLRLAVHEVGAAVQALWLRTPEHTWRNIVLGGDLSLYTKQPPDFFGAVVGPVANRIRGARFALDGHEHELQANDNGHCLHGGATGMHAQIWEVVEHSTTTVVLALHRPEETGGFPGALDARVGYTVCDDGVEVSMWATPSRASPLTLTQHTHVNLAGEGRGDVHEHLLTVAASRFTPVDDALLPTGELLTVDGTALDLRTVRRIGDVVGSADDQVRRAGGLDHNLCLDAPGAVGPPQAVVVDPASGLRLSVFTDQPGLQVYAGTFFDGTVRGGAGVMYGPGAGIALEPQLFPDAVHHRSEPGWPDPVATPTEPFTSLLRWQLDWTPPSDGPSDPEDAT